MKVSSLTVWRYLLELAEPYSYSGGTLTTIPSVIVRLRTDDGTEGWGETCPLGSTYQPAHASGAVAAIREMTHVIVGSDASPRVLGAAMDTALEGHRYAKAAIDIAAWDILGKTAGMPLFQLLGGALSNPVPSYYAIAPSDPETGARIAASKVAEGYRALQIKIGTGDILSDAETIRQIWKQLPTGVALAADANRALLVEEAIHLSRLLSDIPVAFEQPCNTIEEMHSLIGRVSHPVYWDESTTSPATVLAALGGNECDGLGMKVTRVGGITPMLGIRDMAVAKGVKLSIDDSWGGDIIAAACAHLGATVPRHLFRGTWIARPYLSDSYDRGRGINVESGHIKLSEKPGLGVDPDPALLGAPEFDVEL